MDENGINTNDYTGVVRTSAKHKRSAACLICRNRKRKCDGNDPCSYCVSKGWSCEYTHQKKRGPQKKPETAIVSVSPALVENEMLDKIEGQTFTNLYLKYINLIVPMTTRDKCETPISPAQQVQSYSAMAYSARICGDLPKARKYIGQARFIAGSIYDSIDSDSVCSLLMMANYFQLTIDVPLSTHYSKLANSLSRLLPKGQLEYRIKMACQVGDILTDDTTNHKKAKRLIKTAESIAITGQAPYGPLMGSFLRFSALIVDALDYNAIFMTSTDAFPDIFCNFSKIQIDEAKRPEILRTANEVNVNVVELAATEVTKHLIVFMDVFVPMYLVLINWRTGHPNEALQNAITCLRGMNVMQNSQAFAYACGVVDLIHVVMLGGVCEFLYSIGHYNLALQVCDKIRLICKILTPEFDFIVSQLNRFVAKIPLDANNIIPMLPIYPIFSAVAPSSLLPPVSPLSSSSSSPSSPESPSFPIADGNVSTDQTYSIVPNSDSNFMMANTLSMSTIPNAPYTQPNESSFYVTSFNSDMATTISTPLFMQAQPTTELLYFEPDQLLNHDSNSIDLSSIIANIGGTDDETALELLTVVP